MKTFGYLLSTVGLFLLAYVAIINAPTVQQQWLLGLGVILSIFGTISRWLHYKKHEDTDSFWRKEF